MTEPHLPPLGSVITFVSDWPLPPPPLLPLPPLPPLPPLLLPLPLFNKRGILLESRVIKGETFVKLLIMGHRGWIHWRYLDLTR